MNYYYYTENDLDQGYWSAQPNQSLDEVIAEIEQLYGKVESIELETA
jgi:hypothetical protein